MAFFQQVNNWLKTKDINQQIRCIYETRPNDDYINILLNDSGNLYAPYSATQIIPMNKHVSFVSGQTITIPRGTRFCPANRHNDNNVNEPAQNQESQYYLTLDEPLTFDVDTDYYRLNVEINGTRVDIVGFDVNDSESVKKYEMGETCKMPIFAPEGLRYHVNSVAKDPIGLIHSFENRQMITIEPNSTIILHAGTTIVLKTPVSESCVKDGKCPECENYKNNNLYSKILSDVNAKI